MKEYLIGLGILLVLAGCWLIGLFLLQWHWIWATVGLCIGLYCGRNARAYYFWHTCRIPRR